MGAVPKSNFVFKEEDYPNAYMRLAGLPRGDSLDKTKFTVTADLYSSIAQWKRAQKNRPRENCLCRNYLTVELFAKQPEGRTVADRASDRGPAGIEGGIRTAALVPDVSRWWGVEPESDALWTKEEWAALGSTADQVWVILMNLPVMATWKKDEDPINGTVKAKAK